ncbi:MAG TPA: hypothetical protein VF795_00810 [Desulfuromonadaceae bacterium]
MNKWAWIWAAVAVIAVAAAAWLWFHPRSQTLTRTVFQPVPEIRTVRDVQRVAVPCPSAGIVTLDRAEVAKRLDMPELQGGNIEAARVSEGAVEGAASSAPTDTPTPTIGAPLAAPVSLAVTATAEVPASANGTEVVSLIDLQSGASRIEAREMAAPWFRLENRGSVALWYGLNQKLVQTVQGEARWQFLRVKDLHLGLKGDVGTDGYGHAFAGIMYEW